MQTSNDNVRAAGVNNLMVVLYLLICCPHTGATIRTVQQIILDGGKLHRHTKRIFYIVSVVGK